ncbi:hypothetical protein M422DRAFT_248266 [Sphaerobolus stellatus SS14]|uniref:Uncharacterized protein n=1 Tax=Sphaerobolus stellatus (strain SS14) TaxID=990650 RepID=A0A0C9W650_SPHS4|nr:hypothetical protein M422DRAFT_248266 [Sphaerobolus stellatus SS14]
MANYDNSRLESVKAIASETVQVGYETPFNAIQIYQNEDGMHISYKGHMLSIAAWRQGLHQLLKETEAAVGEILSVDLQIPHNYADSWSNVKTSGYSWVECPGLRKYKKLLLQHYIQHRALCCV